MRASRIRILIVMHGVGRGGVEQSLFTLCKYLDKERFEPIVALPEDGPLKASLDDIGVKTLITPMIWWTPIRFHFNQRYYYHLLGGLKERVRGLAVAIEENAIDIVHSATLPVIEGAIAAKLAGRPHIWHLHGNFTGGDHEPFGTYWPIEVLYKMVSELSTKVAAVSETVKKFHAKYIPAEQIETIYNGIDLDNFDRLAAEDSTLLKDFPFIKDKLLIGLVGRIAKVKGTLDFIEAAAKVTASRADVSFLIIGHEQEKEYVEQVRKRVQELDLQGKVILTGARDDIPATLRNIDILVLASKKEGLPYSCLEAMSAGLPVVATRCGGAEELVVDGETGLLVPVGDPARLGEAITSVISDPEVMKKMGDAGRRRVESRFSGKACAEQFEKLYQDLLESRSKERSCSPWPEVLMGFASDIGSLGSRVMEHERLIRGLKDFEALFKNNFLYRTLRACYGALSSKMKH